MPNYGTFCEGSLVDPSKMEKQKQKTRLAEWHTFVIVDVIVQPSTYITCTPFHGCVYPSPHLLCAFCRYAVPSCSIPHSEWSPGCVHSLSLGFYETGCSSASNYCTHLLLASFDIYWNTLSEDVPYMSNRSHLTALYIWAEFFWSNLCILDSPYHVHYHIILLDFPWN